MTWRYKRSHKGLPSYVYARDRRYELRRVTDPCGQASREVWALFAQGHRVWEVHALGRIGIVKVDAQEWIRDRAGRAV